MITKLASYIPQRLAVKLFRGWMLSKSILKYHDPTFFQQVFIEINRHCNRTCPYCPNISVPSPEQYMSMAMFQIVLKRLKDINWSGAVGYHCLSEPLLHPSLVDFIQETKKVLPNSIPTLFTNGDFLTLKNCGELIKAGMQRCSISNHPPLKEGWLERIHDIYHTFPSVVRLHRVTKDVMMQTGGYTKIKFPQRPKCLSPTLMLPIRYNGDYGLCHADAKNEHSFGNIMSHSIMEAWVDYKWLEVRRNLRKNKRDFEVCKKCSGIV